jgi:hypothetical protein
MNDPVVNLLHTEIDGPGMLTEGVVEPEPGP